jgi:hypothetical protein
MRTAAFLLSQLDQHASDAGHAAKQLENYREWVAATRENRAYVVRDKRGVVGSGRSGEKTECALPRILQTIWRVTSEIATHVGDFA